MKLAEVRGDVRLRGRSESLRVGRVSVGRMRDNRTLTLSVVCETGLRNGIKLRRVRCRCKLCWYRLLRVVVGTVRLHTMTWRGREPVETGEESE